LKLSWHVTARDWMAFNLYQTPRSRGIQVVLGVLLAFIVFMELRRALTSWDDGDGALVNIVVLLGLITVRASITLLVCIAASILLFLVSYFSKANKAILTDYNGEFTDSFFTIETPSAKSEVKWTAVQKLARTKKYLFVYCQEAAAIIIPSRSVQGVQWNELCEYISARVTTARSA